MLWIFLLDCVLRASVAPKGFALDSSPRDGFLPAPDPMEKDDRLGDAESIIGIISRSKPSFWRRPGLLSFKLST
jgi:hypothetical protein